MQSKRFRLSILILGFGVLSRMTTDGARIHVVERPDKVFD
jgi:hypothetical protein